MAEGSLHTSPASLSAISTTSSLARVRGFTEDLLFALRDQPLRTRALCEKTQQTHQYICAYLNNMQKYGLVMKNDSFWNLTAMGTSFAVYLEREKEFLKSDVLQCNTVQKMEERKKKEERNVDKTLVQKGEFQSRFDLWLQNSGLSDVEKGVVDYLVSHYNKTKQKFILVASRYELAEQLRVNPETLQDALRNLYQDRVAYCVKYQSTYWKIGLYVAFLEGLQKDP